MDFRERAAVTAVAAAAVAAAAAAAVVAERGHLRMQARAQLRVAAGAMRWRCSVANQTQESPG